MFSVDENLVSLSYHDAHALKVEPRDGAVVCVAPDHLAHVVVRALHRREFNSIGRIWPQSNYIGTNKLSTVTIMDAYPDSGFGRLQF